MDSITPTLPRQHAAVLISSGFNAVYFWGYRSPVARRRLGAAGMAFVSLATFLESLVFDLAVRPSAPLYSGAVARGKAAGDPGVPAHHRADPFLERISALSAIPELKICFHAPVVPQGAWRTGMRMNPGEWHRPLACATSDSASFIPAGAPAGAWATAVNEPPRCW